MTLKDIQKTFRIELVIGKGVSPEALRQFSRVIENVTNDKHVYKMTSPDDKVSYHATYSDIARFLILKGIVGASVQNIQNAVSTGTRAYAHLIESVRVEKEK